MRGKLFPHLLIFFAFFPIFLVGQPEKLFQFSFHLDKPATVSAGLYKGDYLVRTIFNNKHYEAGSFTEQFQPLDDEMQPISDTDGMKVKVLANNVKYEWEGVIGNTSNAKTGSTVWHNYGPIIDLAIAGSKAYYTVGYNERKASYGRFNLNDPGIKIKDNYKRTEARYVDTDGVLVYWGCNDPYSGSKNKDSAVCFVFASTIADWEDHEFKYGRSYKTKVISSEFSSVIAFSMGVNEKISGVAVQKGGNLLAVSRMNADRIDLLDKLSGKPIKSISVSKPGKMRFDHDDNLWVLSGSKAIKFKIDNATVNASFLIEITELEKPVSIAIKPEGQSILIAEAGIAQRIRAFDSKAGKQLWTFGQTGGYSVNGPSVSDDKFYFSDMRTNFPVALDYELNGDIWVGDPGNCRLQHYDPDRKFVNRLAYVPMSYWSGICGNDNNRVFSDFKEYSVNWNQVHNNISNAWELRYNWGANVPKDFSDKYNILKGVSTLSNKRTYAVVPSVSKDLLQVLELTSKGIRFCQQIEVKRGAKGRYMLYKDGSLRQAAAGGIGRNMQWLRQDLKGFDSQNNPVWGNVYVFSASPVRKDSDPSAANIRSPQEVTTSNILIAYDGKAYKEAELKFHLGGLRPGSNSQWLWRTARQTRGNYMGDYPKDGSFDAGNGVVRGGDVMHYAIGRSIFLGYHGEFWKGGQTNMYNHFFDNGLMVGQFGVSSSSGEEAEAGRAGNAFNGGMIEVGGDYYFVHCDEGSHSGVHVWRISNLKSIESTDYALKVSSKAFKSDRKLLMEDLPHHESISAIQGGWKRFPVENMQPDKNRQHWKVNTNIKTADPFKAPDITIQYRHNGKDEAYVQREIKNVKPADWHLTGQLNYAGNYPSTDPAGKGKLGVGGQFFQILDAKGELIFEFYPILNYKTKTLSLIANGVILTQGQQANLAKVTNAFRNFSVSYKNGSLVFTYAGFPPLELKPCSSSAKANQPNVIRFFFWSNGKGADRRISAKDFVFE